ncbi:MAG: succinylglutamate desuccinylase/aspartoacylase family protein [Bdellovibrionales bacterium]
MPKKMRFGDETVALGERKRLFLRVAALHDFTDMSLPVEVIRGKRDGPNLFISAAIHGDEISGVEIVKRVLKRVEVNDLTGTLIAVPIVNVFGYNARKRYLPDRRDLNRTFPGRPNGSLAARLAWLFIEEIVSKCSHGIDLHSGASHRVNLPHIRACLDDPETERLARAFGVQVVLHSALRDGSLREAAREKGVSMMLFEGGEALRFDESVIEVGVEGCLSVMNEIGMLKGGFAEGDTRDSRGARPAATKEIFIAHGSFWVRAPHSGSFVPRRKMGDRVRAGDVLALISDPFGIEEHEVRSPVEGIIIGGTTIPLVHRGDAMFHVATFTNNRTVGRALRQKAKSAGV